MISERPCLILYEVDPLGCPRCRGAMRVIGSIEDPVPPIIRTILKYLGLWFVRFRPPPKIHDPPVYGAGGQAAPSIPDDVPRIPPHDDHVYGDPQYTWDDYIEA